ncbi:MAG: SUMF1/EgtB/PvdO family nonheme iron enzyme [Bacteroidales bacterium]|nr:SUMF1/EgtB/PvdO family nonheme iron enzyme [Bacteroidales bacterium]
MKKLKYYLLGLLILCFLPEIQAQKTNSERKKMNKQAPSGMVWLKDNLYIDIEEVSNEKYKEYLSWLSNKYGYRSEEYIKALPDTLVWRDPMGYNDPYVEYYFRHPGFNIYPVVGVSPKQAAGYCKWRKERSKEEVQNDDQNKTISYRLPTIEEWEFAAKGGNDQAIFPWEGTTMIDKKGNCRAQVNSCIWSFGEKWDPYKSYLTCPTNNYAPNAYGIYCMAGNVAEIVTQKSNNEEIYLLKGGSYNQGSFYCVVNFSGIYEKPDTDIGFRCVCEVK